VRQERANAKVVDILPGCGADVVREHLQIAGVRLDGVTGRIAAEEFAEKIVD
jgi:hypothetical protein